MPSFNHLGTMKLHVLGSHEVKYYLWRQVHCITPNENAKSLPQNPRFRIDKPLEVLVTFRDVASHDLNIIEVVSIHKYVSMLLISKQYALFPRPQEAFKVLRSNLLCSCKHCWHTAFSFTSTEVSHGK